MLDYLAALDQPYREDATNADLRFTRNRIRHELLPLLERDYSPAVVDSLLRLGTLAADAQRVIERLAGAALRTQPVSRRRRRRRHDRLPRSCAAKIGTWCASCC